MKKFIISLLIVAAFVAIPVSVFAQITNTAENIDASARIITPISVSLTTGTLNFGSMTSPSASTSVDIAFDKSRTVFSGSTTLLTTGLLYETPDVPTFTVNGENSAAYTITFPNGTITLTDGSSNEMTVSNFAHNASEVLSATGVETFEVSARLNIGAEQVAGMYTGEFDVTVTYN